MANRRREYKEEKGNGNLAKVNKNGKLEIVTAEEIAALTRNGDLNPQNIRFYCPGEDENGNPCTCKLNLCAWHESCKVSPYFAHRDRDASEHIKGCNCAKNYVNYKIVKTLDMSYEKFDPDYLLKKWQLGKVAEDQNKKEDKVDTATTSAGIYKRGQQNDTYTEIEREFVSVRNLQDMYLLLNRAMDSYNYQELGSALAPSDLIINYKTFEDYRSRKMPLHGPKLIVAGGDKLNPALARRIAEAIPNKPFVLKDPYIKTGDGMTLYYVLAFADEKISKKYRAKIFKMMEKDDLILIFGNVMYLVFDEPGILVCKVDIFDLKCRQIAKLRINEEDDNMIRHKK